MEDLLKSIDDTVHEKNRDIGLLRALRTALFAELPGAQDVLRRVYEVFGEGMARWMVSPARHLSGETPADLLLDGRHEALLTYVGQIEYGVYL